jgi:DNA polymerase elongation subunit (family B)
MRSHPPFVFWENTLSFYVNAQTYGNRIWLRWIDDDGRDRSEFIDDYKPRLFVKSNDADIVDAHSIFQDHPLREMEVKNIKHAKEMLDRYKDVHGFELYGNRLFNYSYLFHRFGLSPKFDASKIKMAFVDIETSVGEFSKGFPKPYASAERITLITHALKVGKRITYHVFCYQDFDVSEYDKVLDIRKHLCLDEDQMLRKYVEFMESDYPHTYSAFNGDNFDVPYIINRIKIRLGDDWAKRLSPLKNYRLAFAEDDPGIVKGLNLKGIELLDTLSLFKKFVPGERDFSLEAIASDFIKAGKVENPTGSTFSAHYSGVFEFYDEPKNEIQALAKRRTELRLRLQNEGKNHLANNDYASLDRQVKEKCWNNFVWYNIRDVDLMIKLEDQLGHINLAFTLAYLVGMNYSDVLGTCTPWEIYLQNIAATRNRFIPIQNSESRSSVKPRSLMGGFVHLYKQGRHQDGVTIDATSLNVYGALVGKPIIE